MAAGIAPRNKTGLRPDTSHTVNTVTLTELCERWRSGSTLSMWLPTSPRLCTGVPLLVEDLRPFRPGLEPEAQGVPVV